MHTSDVVQGERQSTRVLQLSTQLLGALVGEQGLVGVAGQPGQLPEVIQRSSHAAGVVYGAEQLKRLYQVVTRRIVFAHRPQNLAQLTQRHRTLVPVADDPGQSQHAPVGPQRALVFAHRDQQPPLRKQDVHPRGDVLFAREAHGLFVQLYGFVVVEIIAGAARGALIEAGRARSLSAQLIMERDSREIGLYKGVGLELHPLRHHAVSSLPGGHGRPLIQHLAVRLGAEAVGVFSRQRRLALSTAQNFAFDQIVQQLPKLDDRLVFTNASSVPHRVVGGDPLQHDQRTEPELGSDNGRLLQHGLLRRREGRQPRIGHTAKRVRDV